MADRVKVHMNRGRVGIEFLETLSGYFSLGVTDPELGAVQGERRGRIFAIHNVVSVLDVTTFCQDRKAAAELEVRVDFAPFGTGIATETGTFHLFVPAHDPPASLMIYRFGLVHEGSRYFFEGIKTMRARWSAMRLWRQSTRLYSRLHRGSDASGPVVGAGILTIRPTGSLAMARSMHTVGRGTALERALGMARFQRFLADGFWQALRY